MTDPCLPGRQSLRHPAHDYSGAAIYFVTLCTHDRRPLFGSIDADLVVASPLGLLVERCWTRIPEIYPAVGLDHHVVMPNHLHGIVMIGIDSYADRLPSLGQVVGGFKEAVTRAARAMGPAGSGVIWQRGYHDRIVRSSRELAAIREYILHNPANWRQDGNFTEE